MLRRYRRYWVFVAFFLLALPLVAGVILPSDRTATAEARNLAPVPALPDTLAAWGSVPRQVDAYLRDHFGLRQTLLRAYGLIMSRALKNAGNPEVLSGSNGWLFFRGNDMVQQSAGMIRRDDRVAAAVDVLASMQVALAARGIRLLVASPPNSATIVADQLPIWARNPGQRTEYDVFMDDLVARGIPAVDLRPVLAAAQGKVYLMHDTHWTARGALAAFNAMVQTDSHPDWQIDAATALGPATAQVGGDLARMLGIAAEVTETVEPLVLPVSQRVQLSPEPFPTYLGTSDRSGPTIMVIGDSFTAELFPPMLLQRTGRVVWLHHQSYGFDWKWIDHFHPDEVWFMPTERYIDCPPGARPIGLPLPAAATR
jgi:alginate O-acetyltransferase complex protein AlgJ